MVELVGVVVVDDLDRRRIAHVLVELLAFPDARDRRGQGEDQQDSKLNDTIVARFDPEFPRSTGDTISLGVNRERIQLFDSRSGASLLDS